MIELIYISKAIKRFDKNELIEMLKTFSHNNHKVNISGLFLYDGYGTFIQVLEGDPNHVQTLYDKISQDPRHTRVNLLGKTEIKQRNFSEWSMGFKHLQEEPLQKLVGFSEFMQQEETFNYLDKQPHFALEMLDYFKSQINNELN